MTLLPKDVRRSLRGNLTPLFGSGRWLQPLTGVLLIGAGVAYSAWLLEFLLPTGVSPVRSFVSEHYVASLPHDWLFRSDDIIAGCLYLVAAVAVGRLLPRGWISTAIVLGLAVFGGTTIADALFVPDCLTTVDRVCLHRELTGQVSWHHIVHLGSSVISQIAVVAVLFGVERLAAWFGTVAQRWLARFALTVVAITAIGCVTFYRAGWVGVAQRVELIVIAAATLWVAVWLLARGNRERVRGRHTRRATPRC